MLFVNDILENIKSNLDGIFTVIELKLFLILFADDQVVFAKTPDTLQSLLTDIEHYCTEWSLKINTSKTKAMIFEKGRRTYHEFFLYDTKLNWLTHSNILGSHYSKTAVGTDHKSVLHSMHLVLFLICSPSLLMQNCQYLRNVNFSIPP